MILDERLEFADEVDVSAAAGTALIGDVIDIEVIRDIGHGHPIYLNIRTGLTEIITGGVAGTLQFQLASDAQAAIATDGSASIHFQTDALVTDDAGTNAAEFNAGGVIAQVALPLEGVPYERYLGILAITATTTTTAGTINAFLTLDQAGWKSMPDGVN